MIKRVLALVLTIFCMIGALTAIASTDTYKITINGTLLNDFRYDYSKWNNTASNREQFAAICLSEMFYSDDWRLLLPFATPDYSVSTTIFVGEFGSLGTVMVLALEQKEGFMFTYYEFLYLTSSDSLSITLRESAFTPYFYMDMFGIYKNHHIVENANVFKILQSIPDKEPDFSSGSTEPFDHLTFSDFLYEKSKAFPTNASISGNVYNGNSFTVTGYFYIVFKKSGRTVHRELVSIGTVGPHSTGTWSDLIYSLDYDTINYEDSTIMRK